jgi:HD-GYP domain-containing protein (c-di-GMP phosphodiesterase class II)
VSISSHLRDTVAPLRHPHEAWDGSGYPDALSGEAIPVFARVIAIADTIDAMASDRPYRRGLSAEKIRAEISRMSGIQFDPVMLQTLVETGTIETVLRLACSSREQEYAAEPNLSLLVNA